MSPRLSLASVVAVTALEVGLMAGCTDGATPNCSDAAAGCSPDLDGTVLEASPRDSGADVAADADDGALAVDAADAATDAKDDG